MDSSKKCHNSVSFEPIFNFKNAIESLQNEVFGECINFHVVGNFLYTIFDISLKI